MIYKADNIEDLRELLRIKSRDIQSGDAIIDLSYLGEADYVQTTQNEQLLLVEFSECSVRNILDITTYGEVIKKIYACYGAKYDLFKSATPDSLLMEIANQDLIKITKNNDEDELYQIMRRLTLNRMTPTKTLSAIYLLSSKTRNDYEYNLSTNSNCSPEILSDIYLKDPRSHGVKLLHNPNTPSDILAKIYRKHGPYGSYDITFAANPNTPPELLFEIYSK
jgi:hypothetical protein